MHAREADSTINCHYLVTLKKVMPDSAFIVYEGFALSVKSPVQ